MSDIRKAAPGKAPAGWKRKTVMLNDRATDRNDFATECFARGLFCIHLELIYGGGVGLRWDVSHIPSGCRIGDSLITKREAVERVSRIRTMAKWRDVKRSKKLGAPPIGITKSQAARIRKLIYNGAHT